MSVRSNELNRVGARGKRQRGVSMIELLVAFLIFSFGMLGLAGLQTKTLAMNQSALFRSQATVLIGDVFDRMRADRVRAINAGTPVWNTDFDEGSSVVSNAELAAWKAQVEATLPSGQAQISYDSGTQLMTVVIQWDDTHGREAPQQFPVSSRL